MISIVTQNGLSKYDICNYYIVETEENHGTAIRGDDVLGNKGIELGIYKTREEVVEVFADMLHYESEGSKVYRMQKQGAIEEALERFHAFERLRKEEELRRSLNE